jgi:hypothetical protein
VPLDDPRLQRAIHDHMGMAESLAWKFFRRVPGADLDELQAIAAEALCRAADRWIEYCRARQFNPWSEDDPELPEKHFPGYAAKTINGALLDWARHQDHVPRQTRARLKQLQAAQAAGDGLTEQELAAATGLSVQQIREARSAEAARPSSLDYETPDSSGPHEGYADRSDAADVEGQVALNGVLAGFAVAFDSLPAVQRVLLALVYHQELDITVAAKEARLEVPEARRQLEAAVCEIHSALLRAVQAEGTGPRRPAPPLPPVLVRSADCCHAAEAGVQVKRCADCGKLLPGGAFSWRNREKGHRVPYCPPCASARAGAAYVKRKAARLARVA